MPQRLGALLAVAAVLGSSWSARAQSTASFPDPELPASSPPPDERPPAATPPAPGPAPPPASSPAPGPPAPPRRLAPSAPSALSDPTRPATSAAVSAPGTVAGALAFRPPVLPAYGGMEPPDGYRAESSSNRGLVWGGALTLGIGYATALGYGTSEGFDGGLGSLAVPVIGPWLAMGRQSFSCETPTTVEGAQSCQDETFGSAKTLVVLGTVGLVQAVGGTLLIVGLFDRREQWVRDDLGVAELRLDAVPVAGGGAARLQGRF